MKRILFYHLLVVALVFTGCKPRGGDEPQQNTSQSQIKPEGGVYKLDNGVTIVVPAGAVSEATEVKVEYKTDLDGTTGSLPSDIHGLIKFSPEGLVFNKPVEVSMPLNQPVAETTTDIVYWSETDHIWYITDRGTIEGQNVKFYVDHFSSYASVGGGWGDLFGMMDRAVGSASTEETVSAAVKNFLADFYEKQLKDYHYTTRVSAGNICAEVCGIYGFWAEDKNGTTRQGGGTYKNHSTHNIITSIGYSDAQASSHLRNESQTAISRTIEIYGEPCATELAGTAKDSKIDKGKTTEVTITAYCGDDPLADQLIQLSYSPELSCDVVNKKTDANGQVKITVKGEAEGRGIVYAKAVSAVDPDLVTEIQIPVQVGDEGENWRITLDVHVKCTSSIQEDYFGNLYSEDYKVEGGDQSIEYGYTWVADITIHEANEVEQMRVSTITGSASVTNHRNQYKFDAPAFKQSGKWTDPIDIVHTATCSQTLSASPDFLDMEDIPLYGVSYTDGKEKNFLLCVGFNSEDDIVGSTLEATAEAELQVMMKYAFFIPNITGSWSASDSDGDSDNGSWYYGKVDMNDVGEGRYLSLCSACGFFKADELKEETLPIQQSEQPSKYQTGNYTIEMMDHSVHVGIYPDPDGIALGGWLGSCHWTVTGTLKIENLSKEQQ